VTAHRLHLRYRPGADILLGSISLDMLTADAPSHEQPDADTSYTWTPLIDGIEVLTGFQVVHAASRLFSGSPQQLPTAVATHARRLIRVAQADTAHVDAMAALTACHDSHHTLTLRQLRRTASATYIPDAWTMPSHHHTEVSVALDFIADQLDHLEGRQRTTSVGWALREVSRSTRTQLPAPGAIAAAREAVRRQPDLDPSIRHGVLAALASASDPARLGDAFDAAISLRSRRSAASR
jgi:hypothetical protein